ncbi:hypothetical protein Goari_016341, partial [Gossypium aridum]|nr:hypothetical protein [Gossypium aridum]
VNSSSLAIGRLVDGRGALSCEGFLRLGNSDLEFLYTSAQRWSHPSMGSVKFYVDMAVKISYGLAGIRGVLRDHKDVKLLNFAKSIDALDSAL